MFYHYYCFIDNIIYFLFVHNNIGVCRVLIQGFTLQN